jgi:glycine dehydrogenase
MGYGGPHAGFFATSGGYKRHIPGRIIGITRDKDGKKAYRMALQTREQHIKRDRATSNICTAQALLATMSSMYAVFHGRQGLQRIARYIHTCAVKVEQQLVALGYEQINVNFFDTLKIRLPEGMISADIKEIALEKEINLRYIDDHTIGISVDEKDNRQSINDLIEVFAIARRKQFQKIVNMDDLISIEENFLRDDKFLDYEAFNKYRSETELMRYIKKLERKDFSLTHSMISLGSCTMKLNAATEMTSLSWPEFSDMHPFAPVDQAMGYHQLFYELGEMLKEITGLPGISFQPNSGAAGEYTGLLTIREYHKMQNELHRNIMLIPASAHGTNPASAVMAGFKVVVVKCDENGNIDLNDLKHKAGKYSHQLGGIMITYPSTHGVFESKVREMIEIVHNGGGQVYMDGANMNAQVGLTSPGIIGADVCHLNLHKTFSIPHGGGGPGVGPICVAEHLIEFLPTHPVVETGGVNGVNAVSSAPWGSASILAISHAYCKLLGRDGLKESTRFAILNANYLAAQLKSDYDILYTGETGYVGHEFIIDCRPYKNKYAISETDIAKRLMDYGFHAPTLSFPVHGTLMIEPTESESLQELDRFIEAMKGIVEEIKAVENGRLDKDDNPLKNAPHTAEKVISDDWPHLYSRTMAAYPKEWVKENKFWPAVLRVDDAYGDRNLHCTCAPISEHIND